MSRWGSHSNIVELSIIVNETADCTEARYPLLSRLTSNDEATRTRAGSVSDRRVSALGRRPDDPVGSWMGAGSSRLRERLVTPPSVNLWIVRLQSSDVLSERHRSQLDTLPTRTVTCNKPGLLLHMVLSSFSRGLGSSSSPVDLFLRACRLWRSHVLPYCPGLQLLLSNHHDKSAEVWGLE